MVAAPTKLFISQICLVVEEYPYLSADDSLH